jgi:hypothetical protein
MSIIFVLLFGLNVDKSIQIHYTEIAPKIDGVIEDVWLQGDSAYGFVQYAPYEKEPPTENTVVYVLQDDENLYVAFRCDAKKHSPIACLTADEDYVAIGIDPFGSKITAYYFIVYASEIIDDGWILDDGRSKDSSWDGVWYRAVGMDEDMLVVELKIPFKTIRYKKGLQEWGVQFMRYCAANRETSYWTEVRQAEDDLVSRWRPLVGINPQSSGYYFELYPEGYIRYDRQTYPYAEDTVDVKPSVSLNVKWDVTPQMTLNATAFPDFAQIESDPFTLNLDRYEPYLNERRPFFLEGQDIFRMSDFGQGKGFFDPLNIFYSRRIGKSINGDAVPIISGLKLTNKTEAFEFGVLGAYTDEYYIDDSLAESNRWFGVARARHRVLGNSDVGLLVSSAAVDADDYNIAAGFDGVYRKGANQYILQGAVSDRNGKQGWACSGGHFGLHGNFLALGGFEVVHDSFDVSEMGFVPWAGRGQLVALFGPFWQFPTGFVSHLLVAPGIISVKESGDDDISNVGVVEINPGFRNGWGFDLSLYAGQYFEADTDYFYRSVNLSTWGNLLRNHIDFGFDYAYCYNYRLEMLAYRGSNWLSYSYSIIPELAIGINVNHWIEWDVDNTVYAMHPSMRPRIDIKFNADMKLSVFSEFVMYTPGTDIGDTDLSAVRTGALFSWNFMPKSWLYLALNDYREQDDAMSLEPKYQIGAVKVKYLLYF